MTPKATTESYAPAYQRVLDHLDAGTLARRSWRGKTDDGREMLCLWLALVGGDTTDSDYSRCASVGLPEWCAQILPWMDDAGTVTAWPGMIREAVRVLERASRTFDAEAWRRLEYRVRALAVQEAMRHTSDARVLAVCAATVALCDRAARGEFPTPNELAEASAAARAVRDAVLDAALDADALGGAGDAARNAAWNAAWIVAAVAAVAVAAATPDAAWVAVGDADRLTRMILRTIDQECDRMAAR